LPAAIMSTPTVQLLKEWIDAELNEPDLMNDDSDVLLMLPILYEKRKMEMKKGKEDKKTNLRLAYVIANKLSIKQLQHLGEKTLTTINQKEREEEEKEKMRNRAMNSKSLAVRNAYF
jgi:hypothetical protein